MPLYSSTAGGIQVVRFMCRAEINKSRPPGGSADRGVSGGASLSVKSGVREQSRPPSGPGVASERSVDVEKEG